MRRTGDQVGGSQPPPLNEDSFAPSLVDYFRRAVSSSTGRDQSSLADLTASAGFSRNGGTAGANGGMEQLRLLLASQQQQMHHHGQADLTSLLLVHLQQQQPPQASLPSDLDVLLKQQEDQIMINRARSRQRQLQELFASPTLHSALLTQPHQPSDHRMSLISSPQGQLSSSLLKQQEDHMKRRVDELLFNSQTNLAQRLQSLPNTPQRIDRPTWPTLMGGNNTVMKLQGQRSAGTNAVVAPSCVIAKPVAAPVDTKRERHVTIPVIIKEAEEANADTSSEEADQKQRGDDLNNETFPHKLFRMLVEAEEEGNESIVSFFPHGRAFSIYKPHDFVGEIMPKYFTTTRMSSFQRQLNLYGFRRITEGPEKGSYFHDSFLKGRKNLIPNIKRKKTTNKPPASFLGSSLPTSSQSSLIARSLLNSNSYPFSDSLGGMHQQSHLMGSTASVGASSALLLLLQHQRQQQQQQQQREQSNLMQDLLLRQRLAQQWQQQQQQKQQEEQSRQQGPGRKY